MDKNKLSAILFYAAALLFYVTAIVYFVDKDRTGVVFLCLGSAMGCFGSVYLNKYKKAADNLENKSEDKPEDHE